MKVFASLQDVARCVGQEVAVSDWITITQQQVQLFADATGDQQWIHVDPERASKGPFGAPIAHGFLTLSLISKMMAEAVSLQLRQSASINYGLNKVRFPSPVRVGSRLRGHFALAACAVRAEAAVHVGDRRRTDVAGALAAGIRT